METTLVKLTDRNYHLRKEGVSFWKRSLFIAQKGGGGVGVEDFGCLDQIYLISHEVLCYCYDLPPSLAVNFRCSPLLNSVRDD